VLQDGVEKVPFALIGFNTDALDGGYRGETEEDFGFGDQEDDALGPIRVDGLLALARKVRFVDEHGR
jgi:hypothetical protein